MDQEGRPEVDELGIARPLEHDVGGLQIAVDDLGPMQRRERGQAIPDHGQCDSRLEPALRGSRGDYYLVEILPAFLADFAPQEIEGGRRYQISQIMTLDPFHHHAANSAVFRPILHVEQIVLLDVGHAHGDPAHVQGRLLVGLAVRIAFRRVYLQGHGEAEIVGALPRTQVDNSLAAGTQHLHQLVLSDPGEPPLFEDRLILCRQGSSIRRGGRVVPRLGQKFIRTDYQAFSPGWTISRFRCLSRCSRITPGATGHFHTPF